MQKIPAGTWVMVANGKEARLFHNVGSATRMSLKQVELLKPTQNQTLRRRTRQHSPNRWRTV